MIMQIFLKEVRKKEIQRNGVLLRKNEIRNKSVLLRQFIFSHVTYYLQNIFQIDH